MAELLPQNMKETRLLLNLRAVGMAVCLFSWLIGCALSKGQSLSSPWTSFGNGPTHSGFCPLTLGDLPISDGWSKTFPDAINQVAVVDGRIFLTTNHYFAQGMFAAALDAATGNEVWRYPLAPAYSISGVTISDGKILFSRNGGTDGSFIYLLNSASGGLIRQIPFQTQTGTIFGPTVSGDSAWIPAGYYGGLGGFNLADGSQRFVVPLDPANDWTPTYDGKALYACINGVFTANDPMTGTPLWTLDFRRPQEILLFAAQPVVAKNKAFIISFGRLDQDSGGSVLLSAIDLSTHQILWRQPDSYFYPGGVPVHGYSGIPASDGDAVYAISGSAVYSFDANTGQPRGIYQADGNPLLSGQPLITNDLVIVSSTQPNSPLPVGPVNGITFIFDKATCRLKTTLAYGGTLSLADGVLYVVGPLKSITGGTLPAATLKTYNFASGPPPTAGGPPIENISTRLQVGTGDNVGIAGFIITGTQSKFVGIRAIGPSMQSAGVSGVLSDPTLELRSSATGQLLATNNDWASPQGMDIKFYGMAPGSPNESVILALLSPGAYTAIIRGANNTTGVGLIEVYDLTRLGVSNVNPGTESKLANISTRGYISAGDTMIAGFIIGYQDARVLVRGVNPFSNTQTEFAGIADPSLELHDGNGSAVVFNDNWADTQRAEIEATGLAPSRPSESAILTTLSPGFYTAIMRGVNGSAGGALVEVYNLP